MLRKTFFIAAALAMLSLGAYADHATLFKVRIENVSTATTLKSSSGETTGAGLSPGLLVLFNGKTSNLFVAGKADSGMGLERLAEDGNPGPLADAMRKQKGVTRVDVFNTPTGSNEAGPIGPGGSYEFTFDAHPGARLIFAQMFGQSNDLFYAPDPGGIELFDSKGNAISGEIQDHVKLWDAGTEVNQEPGFGPDQAPRQKAPNTGTAEQKAIGPVQDGFTYPAVNQVLKITITHQ